MGNDLVASRELAWRLFVRDMGATYRQSLLGYLWAIIPPVVTTATFVFLNSKQIIAVGHTSVPYPVFVIVGTMLWQTFLDAVNSPLKAVNTSRSMLTKVNFPREALLLSGVGEVVFNFLIRTALLIAPLAYYHLPLQFSILFLPIAVGALMLFGFAIGTIITPVGVLYTDVGRVLTIAMGFWMLLTPVVYPMPSMGTRVLRWNPVTPILEIARSCVTGQPFGDTSSFWAVTTLSMGLLLGSWVLYRVSMPILIERMGG